MNLISKMTLGILTTATLIVGLSGCGQTDKNDNIKTTTYTNAVSIFCDKETGVEYLKLDTYHAGGLTLRVNLDGTPKSCSK
jgi:hypothetical protein